MQKIKKVIRYLFGVFIFIILYTSSSLSPALIFNYDKKENQQFKKIGHRGAAGLAPENTLTAISKGLEHRVDRIEVDVQQTKDGKVILMHDLSLDRTTNAEGMVKDYTYDQIAGFDAGNWFNPAFANEKIPTLEEAIQLINARAELIIEIKKGNDYYPNIEENIINILKENNSINWCIIHSFDTKVLERIHEIAPSIRLHKLFIGKLRHLPVVVSLNNGIETYNIDAYPYIDEYSINYNYANKALIKKLQSKGKKVNVWTANSQSIIDDMIALGVDGIITDFPDKLK